MALPVLGSFIPFLIAPSKLKFGLSCHLIYTSSTMCLSLTILPVGCVRNSRAGNGMKNLQL